MKFLRKLLQEKAMAETHGDNKVTINIVTNQYHLVVFLILLTQFPGRNMTIRPENQGKKQEVRSITTSEENKITGNFFRKEV